MKKQIISYLVSFLVINSFGQPVFDDENDKCGYPDKRMEALANLYSAHWGYSYDSLLSDIEKWELNNNIHVQSIGQSTLGREIYELTITNFTPEQTLKHRIYIHARTHPNEIQSFRVSDEIIRFLSEDTGIGHFLRDRCIFHIVPMYNPDGVELEYPRENANNIDLECNWNSEFPEDEVINLRDRFEGLMREDNPIEIALNMHSAYACKRYFVFHHQNGTSDNYTEMEQKFINAVKSNFETGIESWDYYVSWNNGTPDMYPESWWWLNYDEQILALTYEDMNCAEAGMYDITANAILLGISEYLDLGYVSDGTFSQTHFSVQVYPNPFVDELHVAGSTNGRIESISVIDVSGRIVKTFNPDPSDTQVTISDWPVASGMYILNIRIGNILKSYKLIKTE